MIDVETESGSAWRNLQNHRDGFNIFIQDLMGIDIQKQATHHASRYCLNIKSPTAMQTTIQWWQMNLFSFFPKETTRKKKYYSHTHHHCSYEKNCLSHHKIFLINCRQEYTLCVKWLKYEQYYQLGDCIFEFLFLL